MKIRIVFIIFQQSKINLVKIAMKYSHFKTYLILNYKLKNINKTVAFNIHITI